MVNTQTQKQQSTSTILNDFKIGEVTKSNVIFYVCVCRFGCIFRYLDFFSHVDERDSTIVDIKTSLIDDCTSLTGVDIPPSPGRDPYNAADPIFDRSVAFPGRAVRTLAINPFIGQLVYTSAQTFIGAAVYVSRGTYTFTMRYQASPNYWTVIDSITAAADQWTIMTFNTPLTSAKWQITLTKASPAGNYYVYVHEWELLRDPTSRIWKPLTNAAAFPKIVNHGFAATSAAIVIAGGSDFAGTTYSNDVWIASSTLTYFWKIGSWSIPTNGCDSGTSTRSVGCYAVSAPSTLVLDSYCTASSEAGPKPDTVQYAAINPCSKNIETH